MTDFDFAILAIFAMALVTAAIRIGGFAIMAYVPLRPRLKRMLEALPGSIVAATVLPVAYSIGLVAWLAVGAAAVLMVIFRNSLAGVLGGVAVAIVARQLGL